MNKQRLIRLARRLEQIKPGGKIGFDTKNWWVENECGTQACAVGQAALIPEFAQAGLKMHKTVYSDFARFSPKFGTLQGWSAVCSFFGLSPGLADELFLASRDEPTDDPKFVARKIRRVVALGDIL